MANFCTNCGSRVGKEDNFCTKCGARIDNRLFESASDSMEKIQAKRELKRVVGGILTHNSFSDAVYHNGLDVIGTRKAIKRQVEKEIDSGQITSGGVEFRVNQLILEHKAEFEEQKARIAREKEEKLKMVDEIFESYEIQSRKEMFHVTDSQAISIKNDLKDRLINKGENMSEDEIRSFIRIEFKRANEEQEKAKIPKENEMTGRDEPDYGGYCSLRCRHCYEEYLDSMGGIVGDFDAGGSYEYYCTLGHHVSFGRFCEDYG
ncbi:zinc ribbon domain-containing protein [Methanobrevibacter sp.]|uniref:zinc ribbon domain-containing protein n=1 Tax=Methanobrevibacter sp. TaxID=66852 RepID=UPI00388FD8D9